MDNLFIPALTLCPTKAGLAAGTTSTFSFTANPLNYVTRSKFYTKATQTNTATPTADGLTGALFAAAPLAIGAGSVFVFAYDTAGNIKVIQGGVVTLDPTGAFVLQPAFPVIPDTYCAFGYLLVRLAPATAAVPAVSTWTFGTNNLSGVTGVTYAFQDIAVLPDRPQAV